MTSSSHRLPTISASDALSSDIPNSISTGLPSLDAQLPRNGIAKGQVTEIWGPPGSETVLFGLQVARNALSDGGRVVWCDALHPLFPDLTSTIPPSSLSNLSHTHIPSLAHLFAFLSLPLPPETSLLILSSLSTLFLTAFPTALDSPSPTGSHGHGQGQIYSRALARRSALAGDLLASLSKLAALKNLAVVVLNSAAQKFEVGRQSVLRSAMSARPWVEGVGTRIVMYRDFVPEPERTGRFVVVEECRERTGSMVSVEFRVGRDGALEEMMRFDGTGDDTNGQQLHLEQKSVAAMKTEEAKSASSVNATSNSNASVNKIMNGHGNGNANDSAKRKREEVADSDDEFGLGLDDLDAVDL